MKRTLLALAALVSMATPALADVPSSLETDTSGTLPEGLTFEDVTGVAGATPPKGAKHEVLRVMRWEERDGPRFAVFATVGKVGRKDDTKYESRVLYVTTFSESAQTFTQIRAIKEVSSPCELDLEARFIASSIRLTDLDDDGVGELTFAYVTGCGGDVSPTTLKLLMLEGDDKYALRGVTEVDPGTGTYEGGIYKPDFKKAPKAFLAYAKKVWDEIKRQ
ncbi:MAG: hypothetical protein EP329_00970 [Deltaproteobacteria bacterium]|nr:MAG: hypothetical protein EP329_00970 [Deltaproteobacteria bacterium]